jgi:hypothetical protein
VPRSKARRGQSRPRADGCAQLCASPPAAWR